MLNELGVSVLALREFHQPGLPVDLDQRLGSCAAQADARSDEAPLQLRHRLVGQHLAHDLCHLRQVNKSCSGCGWPRLVGLALEADAKGAIAVVAGEQQKLQQRQARGLLEPADHALAPSIRPRIVDRAGGGIFFRRDEQAPAQRKILAQRKSGLEPFICIPQAHAAVAHHQAQVPDQPGLRRVREPPEVELVSRLVGRL